MIEDVLGEGPVSASRFSQWFSSNMSPSGSRSSSLRSTPHEELEKLAGMLCVLINILQAHFFLLHKEPCNCLKQRIALSEAVF